MKSGFKIFWTNHALTELNQTFEYLEENFTQKELQRLSAEIERVLNLITRNPKLFPFSENLRVRKAIILELNTMYYRENNDVIEILSFFSNRQNPNKRRLK